MREAKININILAEDLRQTLPASDSPYCAMAQATIDSCLEIGDYDTIIGIAMENEFPIENYIY